MELNMETIKHYHSTMIPTNTLKKLVLLNVEDLKAKPTWYEIDGAIQYFKIRDDLRLFTELFFRDFAKNVMSLDTLDYHLACVRTRDLDEKKESTKCGLLSKSFQDLSYNHYLASELMDPSVSDFVSYSSGYSLMSFLHYFENALTKEAYESIRLFLIKLFIADGFTLQSDRNPHNISFKIPKIQGMKYDDRLRIDCVKKVENGQQYLKQEEDLDRLIGFDVNSVFDNEKCLWIDHRKAKVYTPDLGWFPSFPFTDELSFKNGEEAHQTSIEEYDGLDPNLLCLYIEFTEICKPFFERLAYDDEYRKILEQFTSKPSPVVLKHDEYEYVEGLLQDRQQQFQKILKL